MLRHILLALSLVLLGTGCGTSVYQPARASGLELDPVREIDDDDIARAFGSRPQLPERPRTAYFSVDEGKSEDLGELLGGIARVRDPYAVPRLMVDGKRRWDDELPRYQQPERKPLSIKRLRLLAARAKSDVLVVFDYGHRYSSSANGWVATSVLLVPLLFAPMSDYRVESYLDAYVLDVRNGYLYGQVSASERDVADRESLLSGVTDRLIRAQWKRLRAEVGVELEALLTKGAVRAGTPGREESPEP